MRVGGQKKISAREIRSTGTTFDYKALVTRPKDTVYVGMVGGNDPASMAVRHAQSFLRFDRRPAYFSHLFFFTGKGDEILECRLVDADPGKPENGGLFKSRASRYADLRAFPNVAVISLTFEAVQGGTDPTRRVRNVLDAARDWKGVRGRYDLWAMIAGWQPYLFDPARTPNPLAAQYPHPGAAYLRWALSTAGVESSPGAMDEFDAPEHFWAAANYWYKQYAEKSVGVRLELVRRIGDAAGTVRLA